MVGDQCKCNSGFNEATYGTKTICQKTDTNPNPVKNDVCGPLSGQKLGIPFTADYGPVSPSYLGNMIGRSSTSCFPGGCAVSGTVSGCYSASGGAGGSSSSCSLVDVSFTGGGCDDKAQPGVCPQGSSPSAYAAGVCVPDKSNCAAGSSPSKYAAGVCIPDENPCPAGQSPSKYVQSVCVPNESGDAVGNGEVGKPNNCSPGYVPSRYASGVCIPSDSTVTGPGGAGVSCKDGKCTSTKPDGTSEEKPKDDFCKANPKSPICREGSFSGSCASGFQCDGDAIQCSIAREQHTRNCEMLQTDQPDGDYKAAADGTDESSADKLKGKAEQVSISSFDQRGFGWGSSCPADPQIALGFVQASFSIPFSRICGPLGVLSLAGVGITLLGSLVWVLGGKKSA